MKKILMIFMALTVAVAAMAQESNRTKDGAVQFGPYETNRFVDNWFVEVGAGVQGPVDNFTQIFKGGLTWDFGGLAVNANVGKWIDPVWGFRLGWQGLTTGNLDNKITFKESFNSNHSYNYVHGDFLLNFSNLVAGYKETRGVDVVPYLTAGAVFNKTQRALAVGGGIQAPIRITNVVKIAPQLQVLATNARIAGGNGVVLQPSATVSVVVNLGKNNWTRKATTVNALNEKYNLSQAEVTALNDALKASKAANDNLNAAQTGLMKENARLAKELAAAKAEKTVVVNDFAVFFELGKATLSEKELAHLDYCAKNIIGANKKVTFYVAGSTDSATGSDKRNAELRKARAEYVCNLLVDKYGVTNISESEKPLVDIANTAALSRAVVISVTE